MIDRITVLDTETTGMDPNEGAKLLEIAGVTIRRAQDELGQWSIGSHFSSFVEHVGQIPPEARAVHHISPEMVEPGADDCVPRGQVIEQMLYAEDSTRACYAAHNAKFDTQFLSELQLPFICTFQCARHIWPEAPKHSNQVLRYWLDLEPDEDLLEDLAPHRALYDAAVTTELLRYMLRTHSADELLALTNQPVLLLTCNFGKHRGTPWSEVPSDYLRWMIRSSDMLATDADLRFTVEHYLGGR